MSKLNALQMFSTDEARDGFYPTPPQLAEKLLEGIDWDYVENVLEPSAGKGNLVSETLKNMFSTSEEVTETEKSTSTVWRLTPICDPFFNMTFAVSGSLKCMPGKRT